MGAPSGAPAALVLRARSWFLLTASTISLATCTTPIQCSSRVWVAPLDVVLDHDRALIVQPDLFFVSNARDYIIQDRVRGAPDLVIEVLSPYPRIGRTDERVRWFMQYGVRECWLVRQDQRSVRVIQATEASYTSEPGIAGQRDYTRAARIESHVLPDFALSLDDILD